MPAHVVASNQTPAQDGHGPETEPDLLLLKRLGYSSVDPYEFSDNAAAAYVLPPPTRLPTTLHLIRGAPKVVKPEDTNPE